MHFADDVGPDQRAYMCSLIWAFSARHILQYPDPPVSGHRRPRSACAYA